MPKDFFKVSNLSPLDNLSPSSHIHFIGVCGVAMGNLAIALSEEGYKVTGSDKEFYDPMGSALREANIETYRGYSAENLNVKPDLCVIGNAISYGHPEVEVIEKENLAYTCFPTLLYEFLIKGRTSIVVCGTHGKSTTTAIIASTLERLESEPAYFIGGKVQDLERSVRRPALKDNSVSVVEGDEYDDVFFSKKAKFTHYHPDICIINAMEFDHADLYSDFEAVKNAFKELCLSLKKDAHLIYNVDSKELVEAIAEWKEELVCSVHSFGRAEVADLRLVDRKARGLSQTIKANSKEIGELNYNLNIPGEFNARNSLAAILAASFLKLDLNQFTKTLAEYKGVKRRQEILLDKAGRVLIEDFAHHPTAIAEAVTAIKEAYPEKKLWAIYEPRSNTSRLNVFYDRYLEAFKSADRVIMTLPVSKALDQGKPLLDVAELVADLNSRGIQSECYNEVSEIKSAILSNIGSNDVVLLMSNGSFGGLAAQLKEEL